jgi:ABC-type sugar transport system permease subunit
MQRTGSALKVRHARLEAVAGRVPPPARRYRRWWSARGVYWLFLLPAFALLAAFKLYPAIMGVYYSFTNWSGFGSPSWVGLKNYRQLIGSSQFLTILENNGKVIVALPFFVFVPLVIGVVLWERPWGYRFLKAAYFFPAILSPVVIGALFGVLLTVSGPVDSFVRLVIPSFRVDWLGSPDVAMWAVLLVVLWANFGIGVLIYLSALASVPLEMYEAASLDGAGWWRTLWNITIPSLRGVISFWSVIVLISLFTTMFGFVYALTNGGPGVSSTVMEYDVYVQAFTNQDYGYAAAVGVVLLIVTGAFTLVQARLTAGREEG